MVCLTLSSLSIYMSFGVLVCVAFCLLVCMVSSSGSSAIGSFADLVWLPMLLVLRTLSSGFGRGFLSLGMAIISCADDEESKLLYVGCCFAFGVVLKDGFSVGLGSWDLFVDANNGSD